VTVPVLQEEDLVGLTGSIWETVFGRAVEPVPMDGVLAALVGDVKVTACVTITGGWNGNVTIVLPLTAAVRAAADMFGMAEDELDDELVHDAVGELANIAGGNVKGMISEATKLGLPTVVRGVDYTVSVPGTHVVVEAAFTCDDLPFVVLVESPTDLPPIG
jgi:chemotaxis protein CheX